MSGTLNPWEYISSWQLTEGIRLGMQQNNILNEFNRRRIYHGNKFAVNIHDIQTNPKGFYFHFVIHNRDDNTQLNLDIHVTMHNFDPTKGNQFHIAVGRHDRGIRDYFILKLTSGLQINLEDDEMDVTSKINLLFPDKDEYYKTHMRDVILNIIPNFMSEILNEVRRILLDHNGTDLLRPLDITRMQSYQYTKTLGTASDYHKKYLKYKQKYLELKKQLKNN